MFIKKKKAQSKPQHSSLDSQLSNADSDNEDLPDPQTISRKHKVKQSIFAEHSAHSQHPGPMFGRESSQSMINELRSTHCLSRTEPSSIHG